MGIPGVVEGHEAMFVYATWPLACIIHGLQIFYMRKQHPELPYVFALFVLTVPFFVAFEVCRNPASQFHNSAAVFPLFTTFRIFWAVHFILFQVCSSFFLFQKLLLRCPTVQPPFCPSTWIRTQSNDSNASQYFTSIIKVFECMSSSVPRMFVHAGVAFQCAILGAGLPLLIIVDVDAIWAIFTVSHCQLLALLIHCSITIRKLRTLNFFLWIGFVTLIVVASIASFILEPLVSGWPIPVFSAQCILAMTDALGALFRHKVMGLSDEDAAEYYFEELFARLNSTPSTITSRDHQLESMPSSPTANKVAVRVRLFVVFCLFLVLSHGFN